MVGSSRGSLPGSRVLGDRKGSDLLCGIRGVQRAGPEAISPRERGESVSTEERTLLLDKVDALWRRLERVTSERDRAVEAATYFQCYRARRKSDRSAAIAGAIRGIAPETIVDAGAAAAQADRPVEPVTVRMPSGRCGSSSSTSTCRSRPSSTSSRPTRPRDRPTGRRGIDERRPEVRSVRRARRRERRAPGRAGPRAGRAGSGRRRGGILRLAAVAGAGPGSG